MANDLDSTPSLSGIDEPVCAKCVQEIGPDEHPWTVTGGSIECVETGSVKRAVICEDCYGDHNTDSEPA